MGKDPAMPFYVNDWLSSARVACMTLEQQGAYMRLLCHCWASQEAAIPDDDEQLAALSGMGQRWLKNGCQLVRVCFQPHPNKPGFLTNERVAELWVERLEWKEKSRIGGKNSAAKRWGKKTSGKDKGGSKMVNGLVVTKRQPKGNSSSSSSSSSSIVNTPLPPSLDTPAFREAFKGWLTYKAERKEAYVPSGLAAHITHCENMVRDHGEAEVIAAMALARSKSWKGWDQDSSFTKTATSKKQTPREAFFARKSNGNLN